MKRQTETINRIINSLTQDEDHRQDLWVFYLENNAPYAFDEFLKRIRLGEKRYAKDKKIAQDIFASTPKFDEFLTNFTEFEKEIVFLIALECSTLDIARYKDISEVRILQAISVIKSKPAWEQIRKEIHGS